MLRKLARPMIASVYIADGADMIINTDDHTQETETFIRQLRALLPRRYYKKIPQDYALITKVTGGKKIVAGTALAFGKMPRTAAFVLATLSIPSLLSRHAFWETQDKEEKLTLRQGFMADVALLGGLLITSGDTAGKPGLKWRARRAAKSANQQLQSALPIAKVNTPTLTDSAAAWLDDAKQESSKFVGQASEWLGDTSDKVVAYLDDASEKVTTYVDDNKDEWAHTVHEWLASAQQNSKIARKRAIKAAVAAQERATEAYAEAQAVSGKAARKAAKQAERLQADAEKALKRAQAKFEGRF
ncbi:DoxX family protein [Corynebacterium sp. HS2168-gen11]|uniref:DoxX family protein n=1 Tax=Corynebacterium sp. HS2168-gen11 TaxID=2974027 RepID=UPI00216B13EB|nr:DoxX family protein [Corynebacterium sp. HS2168-gen11]MCS4534777.1 DoxX family protein [Corynebacterium sp. HS2168-gen11]